MTLRRSKPGRTIYLKHCPRCSGDIGVGSDQYGGYIHCLQCGYMADIENPRFVGMPRARAIRDNVA